MNYCFFFQASKMSKFERDSNEILELAKIAKGQLIL